KLNCLFPQAKTPHKCVGIVAEPATWRHQRQFLGVASSENHIVRMEAVAKAFNAVEHMPLPSLLPQPLQSPPAYVIFQGGSPISNVPKLYGYNIPILDEGRT